MFANFTLSPILMKLKFMLTESCMGEVNTTVIESPSTGFTGQYIERPTESTAQGTPLQYKENTRLSPGMYLAAFAVVSIMAQAAIAVQIIVLAFMLLALVCFMIGLLLRALSVW